MIELRSLIANLAQTIAQNNQRAYTKKVELRAIGEINSVPTRLDEVSKFDKNEKLDNSNNELKASPQAVRAEQLRLLGEEPLVSLVDNCAKYVRMALNQAGIKLQKTPYAKDVGVNLKKVGFKSIGIKPTQAKPGDVAVFQPVKGHPYGHMAIYDGKRWISDFKQNTFGAGAYNKARYQIYREP